MITYYVIKDLKSGKYFSVNLELNSDISTAYPFESQKEAIDCIQRYNTTELFTIEKIYKTN
jgi:hypothetical protein